MKKRSIFLRPSRRKHSFPTCVRAIAVSCTAEHLTAIRSSGWSACQPVGRGDGDVRKSTHVPSLLICLYLFGFWRIFRADEAHLQLQSRLATAMYTLNGGKSRGYCATEQLYAYREFPLTAERPLHGVFFLFRATEAKDSALTAKLARDALKHT